MRAELPIIQAMENSLLQSSTTLGRGRYRILSRIGQGQMGTVYKAALEEFPDQLVALKVIAPEHLGNRRVLQRFQTEMDACYRISHPNVVKPIEIVREKELFGFSMEFVDGGNLAEYTSEKSCAEKEVVSIIRQVASALSAVHSAGIIHRDLKPENILLTKSGVVKLTDFGTALMIGGPRLTSEGNVLGSIPYLSPEYIENQVLDQRSDLYSLGIVAYELLVGEVPFATSGIVEMVNRKLHGEVITLPMGSCSSGTHEAIGRLLAKDPNGRYQSAAAVEAEFRLLEGELSHH